MGNTNQKLENYITNNVKYSQVISSTLNLKNTSDTNVINVQSFKIQNGGSQMCCCETATAEGDCVQFYPTSDCAQAQINCPNINIGQTINNNIRVVQQIDSQFTQQLAAQLQTIAQADIANAIEQMQQADPTSAFAKASQEILNNVTNEIDQRINVENVSNIVNNVLTNIYNAQTQTINNCGVITGEMCDFSQDIYTTILVQNILSAVANQFSDATATNDLYTKVTTDMSQSQTGVVGSIAGAISGLFESLGSLALILIIGGGLVIFIIIAVIVALVFFKGGGKEIAQQAAATYLQPQQLPLQRF